MTIRCLVAVSVITCATSMFTASQYGAQELSNEESVAVSVERLSIQLPSKDSDPSKNPSIFASIFSSVSSNYVLANPDASKPHIVHCDRGLRKNRKLFFRILPVKDNSQDHHPESMGDPRAKLNTKQTIEYKCARDGTPGTKWASGHGVDFAFAYIHHSTLFVMAWTGNFYDPKKLKVNSKADVKVNSKADVDVHLLQSFASYSPVIAVDGQKKTLSTGEFELTAPGDYVKEGCLQKFVSQRVCCVGDHRVIHVSEDRSKVLCYLGSFDGGFPVQEPGCVTVTPHVTNSLK